MASGLKRKRGKSFSGPATKKRITSGKKKGSKPLRLRGGSGSSKRPAKGGRGPHSKGSFVKQQGTKVHKEAVGKKIKVSKSFKQKVRKAVESKEPYGFFQETFTGSFRQDINDLQVCAMIPRDDSTDISNGGGVIHNHTTYTNYARSDGCNGIMFDPSRYLNAASVLWKEKPPASFYTMTDSTNFDPRSALIHVRKSWAKITLRNNTLRGYTVKLFVCSPNQIRTTNLSPLDEWELIDKNLKQQTATTGTAGIINRGTFTEFPETHHTEVGYDPRHLPEWKKWWGADVTTYYMEPGEMVTHTVTGPTEKLLRYQKFLAPASSPSPGVLLNSQKFTKWVMAVAYPDLVAAPTVAGDGTAVTGWVGRIVDVTGPAKSAGGVTTAPAKNEHSILFETTMYYELSMPEQTGGRVDTTLLPANVQFDNTERHDAFAIKYWTNSLAVAGGQTTGIRRDEMNPVVDETD